MSKQLKTLLIYSAFVLAFMAINLLNNGNQFNILYILWGLGPTIAAIITTALFYGKSSIKELFSRVIKGFGLKWLAILILLQLIIYLAGVLIYSLFEGMPGNFSFSLLAAIPSVFAVCFITNIWEEMAGEAFFLKK
jgi:hypothetical protein